MNQSRFESQKHPHKKKTTKYQATAEDAAGKVGFGAAFGILLGAGAFVAAFVPPSRCAGGGPSGCCGA